MKEQAFKGDAFVGRTLVECFSLMPDPRVERSRRHKLVDILTIAVCAVICGADSFTEIEAFGLAKKAWFGDRLELAGGIPSHDTFRRVFALMDPEIFEQCFTLWASQVRKFIQRQLECRYPAVQGASVQGASVQGASVQGAAITSSRGTSTGKGQPGTPRPVIPRSIINLDGKSLRHSFDTHSNKGMLHTVSAWAADLHLSLAQVKVDDKSNEITAIPIVLDMVDIQNCIVTIDAMGCQKEIARQIIDKGGDYILALKGNQGQLATQVELFFKDAIPKQRFYPSLREYVTAEKDHGRIEKRKYYLADEQSLGEDLSWIDPEKQWSGLKSLGMVRSERTVGDKTTTEERYFLASISGDVQEFARGVRCHWGIENSQHWVLDIAFREDECRLRIAHAAHNFATLRKIALNLIKQEKTAKGGVKARRLRCGWDLDYLALVLAQHYE